MTLKIAVATPDGEKLSPHFGETPWYEVFTVENGQIVARERRHKPHHEDEGDEEHAPGEHAHLHRPGGPMDFFAPISDCNVLIAGGMGDRAYEWARQAGLEVYLTRGTVESALQAYLAGELKHDPRRVHASVGAHGHGHRRRRGT